MEVKNMKTSVLSGIFMLVLLLITIFVLFVSGCASTKTIQLDSSREILKEEYMSCNIDEDCICKGVFPGKQQCYIGNIDFYEKYVDKKSKCPADDFCKGPEEKLTIRCMANICMQLPECSFDVECDKGLKCIKNECI